MDVSSFFFTGATTALICKSSADSPIANTTDDSTNGCSFNTERISASSTLCPCIFTCSSPASRPLNKMMPSLV